MNPNACFCRSFLRHVRNEAKKAKVPIPKHFTAMRMDSKWFLVEGAGGFRQEITADNAFDAKAKIISSWVTNKLARNETD